MVRKKKKCYFFYYNFFFFYVRNNVPVLSDGVLAAITQVQTHEGAPKPYIDTGGAAVVTDLPGTSITEPPVVATECTPRRPPRPDDNHADETPCGHANVIISHDNVPISAAFYFNYTRVCVTRHTRVAAVVTNVPIVTLYTA